MIWFKRFFIFLFCGLLGRGVQKVEGVLVNGEGLKVNDLVTSVGGLSKNLHHCFNLMIKSGHRQQLPWAWVNDVDISHRDSLWFEC